MLKNALRLTAVAASAAIATSTVLLAATAPAQAATSSAGATMAGAQAAAVVNTLLPGQRLTSGQIIRSTDRQWTLVMRPSGNVELVRRGSVGADWQTGTARPGSVLVMETDGSLSVVHGRTKYWSSGAAGNPNSKLVLATDGSLTIFNSKGRFVWNRHMVIGTMYPGNEIQAPTSRGGAVSVFSPNRIYTLQMRPTGLMVLLQNNKTVLWSGPYTPNAGDWGFLTTTGTFGVTDTFGSHWSIATNRGGTVLQVRDDGKLLLVWGRTVVKTLH